jgi:hypothetical protein
MSEFDPASMKMDSQGNVPSTTITFNDRVSFTMADAPPTAADGHTLLPGAPNARPFSIGAVTFTGHKATATLSFAPSADSAWATTFQNAVVIDIQMTITTTGQTKTLTVSLSADARVQPAPVRAVSLSAEP